MSSEKPSTESEDPHTEKDKNRIEYEEKKKKEGKNDHKSSQDFFLKELSINLTSFFHVLYIYCHKERCSFWSERARNLLNF